MLGYPLGADSESYHLQISTSTASFSDLAIGVNILRKGEWYVGDPWDSSYNEKTLPTGVVQTTTQVQVDATKDLNQKTQLKYSVYGGTVTNLDHQLGNQGWDIGARVGIKITGWL